MTAENSSKRPLSGSMKWGGNDSGNNGKNFVVNFRDFKRIDFDTFKENAGSNAFFSIRDWTEKPDAIGMFTKSGRYGGGIYAHIDIAFECASWILLLDNIVINRRFVQ